MKRNKEYNFLPFRFKRNQNRTLLVNDTGEYIFLSDEEFDRYVNKTLLTDSELFYNLKAKDFLFDGYLPQRVETLSTKYRTKNQFLYNFTSLHMFVITLRCNQKCLYCHASSQDEKAGQVFDMNWETAKNSVEMAFKTPSQNIKIEFQGGEPLLNFDIVKNIIQYAEEINESHEKNLEFVLCTNLTLLQKEHLDYLKEKKVYISTSLDGSREIHNKCRRFRNGEGSYDRVIGNLKLAMNELGPNWVTALMTVTPHNIHSLKEVIDEYLTQKLGYIFFRTLNPFGYAYKNDALHYSTQDFIKGYKEALDYIIEINSAGTFFPEIFASILLSRILTPFSTGFVDLQSPAGTAISGVIYDVNGDVFVSDEARMMYRTTGDKYFCLGNVNNNSWQEIYCGTKLRKIISASCIDALPGCAWCVYKTYCGGDPVRNYLMQGDMVGFRPENEFCKKHKALFDILFEYLELQNDVTEDVFWSWITVRKLSQVQNYCFEEPLIEAAQ